MLKFKQDELITKVLTIRDRKTFLNLFYLQVDDGKVFSSADFKCKVCEKSMNYYTHNISFTKHPIQNHYQWAAQIYENYVIEQNNLVQQKEEIQDKANREKINNGDELEQTKNNINDKIITKAKRNAINELFQSNDNIQCESNNVQKNEKNNIKLRMPDYRQYSVPKEADKNKQLQQQQVDELVAKILTIEDRRTFTNLFYQQVDDGKVFSSADFICKVCKKSMNYHTSYIYFAKHPAKKHYQWATQVYLDYLKEVEELINKKQSCSEIQTNSDQTDNQKMKNNTTNDQSCALQSKDTNQQAPNNNEQFNNIKEQTNLTKKQKIITNEQQDISKTNQTKRQQRQIQERQMQDSVTNLQNLCDYMLQKMITQEQQHQAEIEIGKEDTQYLQNQIYELQQKMDKIESMLIDVQNILTVKK